MKNYFTICLIFTTCLVWAQDGPPKRDPKFDDKIKSMKIAYLTEKLDLSPDESQNFGRFLINSKTSLKPYVNHVKQHHQILKL